MPELTPQQAFDLAFSHHAAGRLSEAQNLYQLLLQQNPHHPDALHLLGLVAHQQNQHDRARDLITRAIALNPQDAAYHSNLAEVLRALHQPEAALDSLQRALALKPNYPAALTNRANILLQLRRLPEAEAAARQALALQPNMPEALHNLGTIFQEQNLFKQARQAYEQALAGNSNLPNTWNNLATIYEKQNQLPHAQAAYERAIALNPQFAAAHNHLGLLLHRIGHTAAAIPYFENALRADPNFIDARWNLALALLLTGNLARGWEEYEHRWQYPQFPSSYRQFDVPLWTGQDLTGKTILLHAEQGFGDAIHFVRYAPLVARRGAKVLVECRPELVRLFQSIPGITVLTYTLGSMPQTQEKYDYHSPFLSLPRAFGTTLETIPHEVPYLSADPALVAHFKNLLAQQASSPPPGSRPPSPDARSPMPDPRPLLRIGLVWAGSSAERAAHYSSGHASLKDFAPLSAIPGTEFISLQVGPARTELSASGFPAVDVTEQIKDFADTAALIANLDLVVTVDTAVAHLAGALAKPALVLLPTIPDWRWLQNRPDSPWYPTLKLVRQTTPGDWLPVIQKIQTALQSHLSQP